MLTEHRRINRDRLDSLPHAPDICLELGKDVVVAGAGPSLDECAPALRRHRSKFVLVAASGAVPPLRAAGIDPDWVVALEGKDTVVNDLADLPEKISTVVFECTHPQIVRAARRKLFFGDGLETRGGTTLIPALDFALQCSMEDVILVGADLGYGNRVYASGAKRECLVMSVPSGVPPKFLAMRAALENLLDGKLRAPRTVYHALRTGPALRGALRVQPDELGFLLAGLPAEKETV
jgi:hypothetical protein